MNLEEIKNYLSENKDNEEVQALLKGFNSINQDDVKAYLDTDDGKKVLQPKLDSFFTKGLTTWQDNNLDKLINDKLKEMNPDKSPEALELDQIKQQLAQIQNEKTREVLKNKALTVATEKNIPTNVIDFLLGDNEESTISNLSTFEESMKVYVDSQVKARISDSSYVPPAGDSNKKTAYTLEQIKGLSEQEITENWDAVQDTLSNKQ